MQENRTDQELSQNQERYADELSGPDDYWLTITDAARATRRQEVSIRRWISKGLLPVRRQNVGLNQRTRLVRASDLAALTPIIDPAGAITSERSRLDLTSIPVQQAQIKASQQTLLSQLEQIQHQLYEEAQTREHLLTKLWTKYQEITTTLRNEMLTNAIQQQDALAQQRKEVDTTIERQCAALEHAIDALSAQTNIMFTELAQKVTAIAERLETSVREWQNSTQQQQQHIDVLAESLRQERENRDVLARQVKELSAQLAEQRTEHQQVREQLAQQVAHLTSQATEQQARYEHEARIREQLVQQIAHLVEQLAQQSTEQEQVQHRFLDTLTQQQEQLAALKQAYNEQSQHYEIVLQDYVKLRAQQAEQEQAVRELRRMVEQQEVLSTLAPDRTSELEGEIT
jgi:chromosome segregation ATPase